MYVPDRSKTKEMCDQVIIENGGMLRFIPDCCKVIVENGGMLIVFRDCREIQKCVIKLLIVILMH